MTAALSLWWRLRSLDARHDRVPGLLSVIAFAVATGALLVSLGGLHAFESRNAGDVSGPDALWPTIGETYVTLAWVAVNVSPDESDVRTYSSVAAVERDLDPDLFLRHLDLAPALFAAAMLLLLVQAAMAVRGTA